METTCPRCKLTYDIDPSELVPLTDAEQVVFDALRLCQNGHPVKTRIIADVAGYTMRWTQVQLKALERRQLVTRPNGPKSGWYIPHRAEHRILHLFQAA